MRQDEKHSFDGLNYIASSLSDSAFSAGRSKAKTRAPDGVDGPALL